MTDIKKTKEKTIVAKLPKAVKLNFEIPDTKEFLKTGAQFGHQSKRWDPKMAKYIFTKRGNIHIIDLSQTIPLLKDALKFLVSAASKGDVMFVATKRQSGEIIKSVALESHSYYIIHRWPGGFFTNHSMIRRSFKKLQDIEEELAKGVEGRTKYEVSVMKKGWQRLNRLYEGVKTITSLPKAIVVVDPNYERKSIREAQQLGIPVVAIIDTNCNPDGIQFPIPANDDAIKSIKLIIGLIGKAVEQGNDGKGVKHDLKDYSKVDVKLIKPVIEEEKDNVVGDTKSIKQEKPIRVESPKDTPKTTKNVGTGLLGRSRGKSKEIKLRKIEKK